MKRFPWRLVLVFPILSFGLISCEPTEDDDVDDSYPSNNISVSSSQGIFVSEITNVTCGTCPPTQEIMEVLKTMHPGRIIPMSLHVDTLYNPAVDVVYSSLGHDQSNNFLLFINGVQVSSDPYVTVQDIIDSEMHPVFGVGHATGQNDTAWIVYPRIEMYADNQNDYYINSYVMMDGAVAKAYGSYDLTQAVSGDPRLQQGSGGGATLWVANGGQTDTADYLYSAGTPYTHADAMIAGGVNDTNQFGVPLSTINPIGQSYFSGDIIGNQYTPIEIYIPKPEFNPIQVTGADMKVVTIVWQRIPGSPDVYVFANGYYSEF